MDPQHRDRIAFLRICSGRYQKGKKFKHVRLAKDAQRLKNMQLSKLGEISSLSTVEKPIVTPEQIAGHQNMWKEDNIKDDRP